MSTDPKPIQNHFRTKTRPADMDDVQRLVRTTGVFSKSEIAIARELVEENLGKGDEASGYFFLIADGANGIDGYTCFGPIAGTEGRYELYWIAVDPKGTRSRLGRRLLAATEDAIRAKGGVYIFAETSSLPSYDPARKFYLAQGYALKGAITDWHADGDGLEIYGKRLT
jgi:ribosomal protein S18 acetylase RimI-like enzyme